VTWRCASDSGPWLAANAHRLQSLIPALLSRRARWHAQPVLSVKSQPLWRSLDPGERQITHSVGQYRGISCGLVLEQDECERISGSNLNKRWQHPQHTIRDFNLFPFEFLSSSLFVFIGCNASPNNYCPRGSDGLYCFRRRCFLCDHDNSWTAALGLIKFCTSTYLDHRTNPIEYRRSRSFFSLADQNVHQVVFFECGKKRSS